VIAHHHTPAGGSAIAGLLATAVHTAGYLAVSGLVAWVVYRKLGLALLRKAWFNVDLGWAAALVISGLVTLMMQRTHSTSCSLARARPLKDLTRRPIARHP
jgi:hypothetical protein